MRPVDDAVRHDLQRLHDTCVSTGTLAPGLRPLVSDSWRRSVRTGVDPEHSTARL